MPHDSSTPEPTPSDFSDEAASPEGIEEHRSDESTLDENAATSESQVGEELSSESVSSSELELQASDTQPDVQDTAESFAAIEAESVQPSSESVADEALEIEVESANETVDRIEATPASVPSDAGLEVVATDDQSPEPSSPASSEPVQPAPVAPAKESALDTVGNFITAIAQLIRKTVQAIIPLFRAIIVLVLRFAIQILQLLLDVLEGAPAIPSVSGEDSKDASGVPTAVTPKQRRSIFAALGAVWSGLVHLVRTVLPERWNQKLPAPLLNLLLAGVIAFALWLTPSVLLARSPSTATKPPLPETPLDEPVPPSEAPEQPPVQDGTNGIEIPLDPVVSESGDVSFPPPTGLPAAQRKSIETLQKQLVDLRSRYASTPLLIQSAHVNARRDRLTVELGDDWYELPVRRQDRLAEDLWQRSQQAGLPKLLLVDREQTVLARSPMVGTEVLVLQRQPQVTPANTPIVSEKNE